MGVSGSTQAANHVQAKRVEVEGRPPVAYDMLSIDVGITPAATAVPGALQFATPVKPISRQGTRPAVQQA